MRYFKVWLMVALFAVVGVGVIHAADDNGIPVFNDGRVNNWQIDAPVAVYCIFDHTQDVNVGVFQSIDVWGLDGNKILTASAAQIDDAMKMLDKPTSTTSKTAPSNMIALDAANGYTLSELTDGSFQASAPNGYVFSWARGAADC